MGDKTYHEGFSYQVPNPKDYHVSHDYGFMLPDPLTRLPDYFEPWNTLAHSLPELTEKQAVREEVRKLSELDHEKLSGYRQYRCAHLMLSSIVSAYLWQEGETGVETVLPRQLAVAFHGVACHLGLPPVILHASSVLANCRFISKERGPVLSNLTSTITFAPREACDWFYVVTALVELAFAPAIKVITEALSAVLSDDKEAVYGCLNSLSQIIQNMQEATHHMHDKLPGNIFYNNIRPFLTGWGGAGSPLPDGLIYEGVSTKPIKMTGGSAAQSSTLHCLDAVLGIQHHLDKQEFLDTMKTYMPPAHAQYIEAVKTGPSVKDYVLSSADRQLREAYDQAVNSLHSFRSYHVQIVSKYIVQQTASQKTKKFESLAEKGTGGTSIMPFLKDIRDTTRSARIN